MPGSKRWPGGRQGRRPPAVAVQRRTLSAALSLPRQVVQRLAGEPLVIDGRRLDPRVQLLARLAAARAPSGPPEVAALRQGEAELVALAAEDPERGVAVHDRTIPGPAGPLPVRLYHPPSAVGGAPALVWFHMGGWVIGSLATSHALCTRLARRAGAVVMSVDYRLAPEHRFPAQVDDALAAVAWMIDNASALGVDPHRVAVGGGSAGGTLAAVVCQQRRRRNEPQPAAQVLVYPLTDWTLSDRTARGGSLETCADCFPLPTALIGWFRDQALPDEAAASDERASPARSHELWGLAPAVVVTAGFDPLRDQGLAYAGALEAAGVPVRVRCEDALPHAFTVLGGLVREARRATGRLVDDVAAVLGS